MKKTGRQENVKTRGADAGPEAGAPPESRTHETADERGFDWGADAAAPYPVNRESTTTTKVRKD
jgi:hypothetical protein